MYRGNDGLKGALGDAYYDAWMSGLNPDEVDVERVTDDYREGYDRFECAEREVGRMRAVLEGGEDE